MDEYVTVSFTLGGLVSLLLCLLLSFVFMPQPHSYKGLPLPPTSPASALENFRKKITQKGLTRVHHVFSQGQVMHAQAIATGGDKFKYGTAFRMKRFSFLENDSIFIHVTDYKLARIILLGDKEKGIPEGIKKNNLTAFNIANRGVGNLFTTTSLDKRREMARKQIAPSFSTTNLLPTMAYLNANIQKVFAFFDTRGSPGEFVDMKEVCLSLFIETLTKASFDVEFSSTEGPDLSAGSCNVDGKAFLADMDMVLRERAFQALAPFRKHCFWMNTVRQCDEACKRMDTVIQGVLRGYRERNAVGAERPTEVEQSIMNRIMHMPPHIYPNDDYRISEIVAFIIAGHETSAFTLCFFLMEMAKNPECKKKLQLALDNTIRDRNPSHSEVTKVDYLQWCIKESMRLWPVAATGSARTLEEDIEYNGMILPKGAVAQTVFYAIFRSSWIDKADEFIPERWSEENPQISDLKDMFMPFSLGKRGCIGQNMAQMQLRVIAANFMRFYDFELVEDVRFEHFLTIKPDNLRMKVTPR